MNRLSYFVGRKVTVYLNNHYIVRGHFERYEKYKYYVVLRDGSRMFFNERDIHHVEFI